MILHFPNHETLRLALTSGIIPDGVGLAAIDVGFGADGDLSVKTEERLARSVSSELKRLGVTAPRTAPIRLDQRMSCWQQVLPLARDAGAIETTAKTPVLFELYRDEQFPELVSEMLRLGNDRQGFRLLSNGADARALLRVFEPPYYTLLRALERGADAAADGAPRAYVEQSPRVWVEIGFRHELADKIKPPAGKLLLLRSPREWTLIDEMPFRDIYETLDFKLPDSRVAWQDTELDARIRIPLSLAAGGTSDAAELWVLRENAEDQVEKLVLRSDDQLLSRLAFAIGKANGETTIVIRVRPSKKTPPVLVLDGMPFRSYLKLPNLFLPVGRRLQPPLRRDAVASLLSPDQESITWLYPLEGEQFQPESLMDAAFRPLSDWVDYVLDHEHEALDAWIGAHRFEFDTFICEDDEASAPRSPLREKRRPDQSEDDPEHGERPIVPVLEESEPRPVEDESTEDSSVTLVEESFEQDGPDELQQRLEELEASFHASETPLDSEELREIWQEMAVVNATLEHRQDSTVCWANALWEETSPSRTSLAAWVACERQNAPGLKLDTAGWESLISDVTAKPAIASMLVAYLNEALYSESPPEDLVGGLPYVSRFLEQQESYLPIRTAWMAWTAVTQLVGGDVLTLARARDRLLERLFQHGMRPELDMPVFLRSRSGTDSERFRVLRDHMRKFRERVRDWIVEPPSGAKPQTKTYSDLIFGFGLANLGETDEVYKLLNDCERVLQGSDTVHRWIHQAYDQRVKQALAGEASRGRLDENLLDQLESIEGLDGYKIDRLRSYSRILEPTERVDSFGRWTIEHSDELSKELATLFDENNRDELRGRLQAFVTQIGTDKKYSSQRVQILTTALELSSRLGASTADEMLGRVEQVFGSTVDVVERALLLEKGLLLAAHFDKTDYVQMLISHFETEMPKIVSTYLSLNIQESVDKEKIDTIDSLFSQSLRGLRRLGMREEMSRLFGQLGELVHDELENSKRGSRAGDVDLVRSHKLLLNAAGSWFYFGRNEQALRIADEVRDQLFAGKLTAIDQRTLACSYVNAVGQADLDIALPRLDELFSMSKGKPNLAGIEDTMATSSHFSISQIDLIETVVLTLVSDDFSLDRESRRWLDEDEFLVRRRIHRDVREAMGGG